MVRARALGLAACLVLTACGQGSGTPDESATAVRAGVAAGDPAWRGQVPAAVAAYIQAQGLYRAR